MVGQQIRLRGGRAEADNDDAVGGVMEEGELGVGRGSGEEEGTLGETLPSWFLGGGTLLLETPNFPIYTLYIQCIYTVYIHISID